MSDNKNVVVIVSGSTSDSEYVNNLVQVLLKENIYYEKYVSSAHKQTAQTLELIQKYEKQDRSIIWVTVAGRSNALSAVISANSRFPVIACPPFKDKVDMMVNIHSTLQCPSNVPVMTILDTSNAILACKKIFSLLK